MLRQNCYDFYLNFRRSIWILAIFLLYIAFNIFRIQLAWSLQIVIVFILFKGNIYFIFHRVISFLSINIVQMKSYMSEMLIFSQGFSHGSMHSIFRSSVRPSVRPLSVRHTSKFCFRPIQPGYRIFYLNKVFTMLTPHFQYFHPKWGIFDLNTIFSRFSP